MYRDGGGGGTKMSVPEKLKFDDCIAPLPREVAVLPVLMAHPPFLLQGANGAVPLPGRPPRAADGSLCFVRGQQAKGASASLGGVQMELVGENVPQKPFLSFVPMQRSSSGGLCLSAKEADSQDSSWKGQMQSSAGMRAGNWQTWPQGAMPRACRSFSSVQKS